ncbi:MAG TPA: non-ribosomal peptide synthase/polyketide synthase [Longimicrobium sp.]
MSDVVDCLEGLSPERQALLHEILRQKLAREREQDGVRPRQGDGPAPLSFAQQRLWLIDQVQPGSAAYNMPFALRLGGALDVGAMERALGEIVRRHQALRTVFPEADGGAVQVIAPFGFILPVEDLSALDADDREAEVLGRATDEARRPFDLAKGPLFRAALLRLADDDHVLLLTLHHIVTDAWSTGVLFRELGALYTAYRDGAESPLPELAVQYADYAVWQRERLQGETLEAELSYWRERLAGAPALLELPTDRPRPAVQTHRGGRVPFRLSAALTERLREVGRREDATLYMVLLAAFQVLLGKYAGTDDVVVGSPVAGRTRREVEELIGFFINTLVLRTDLSGDPAFGTVLCRVREATLGAYEHQQVPFEKLVDELQPERSLSHAPLFQVMFSLQNAEPRVAGLAGLRIGELKSEVETTKFDLTLSLLEGPDGVEGVLIYGTDLFDPSTAERMAGHLARVLEQVAADPGARLSSLQLVDDDERRMLVEEWNQTDRPYPRDVCLHALFARHAAERPDAPALEWDGLHLTYAELDARANRLAHHLVRHGVGPESRVGVLLERGAELIVSILAILKAGGCYVPLDPAYPDERLRLMLADAGARVLVTRGELAAKGTAEGVRAVLLDGDADAIAAESPEAPENRATAQNLAYIVYTSGSTGRPKGVMVSHRTVVQLVVETDYVRFAPGDRIAQASNASFDALAFEAWGAFLNGATLVGIGRDVLLSPDAMCAFLRDQHITTLYQTTALLNQLSREHPDVFSPLREVLFGGQQADADAVRRVVKHGKPRRLLHMYGPTETTAWCSYAQVEQVDDDALTVSVGRPTGNQRIYLLDSALHPVPVGIPGEAYVGGGGVVRGYLNRPALTAERFVPDPFAAEPGARMYRTGDRLRWRRSAEVRECVSASVRAAPSTSALTHSRTHALPHLEFVGRLDAQVKIRGFRIEPGEIESALSAHPAVREARVVVRQDEPGEKRLVAYVVGDADAEALRAHLRRSLPEYMVPAAFVALDRLPLTPNGKLDEKALPAPEYEGAEERYVAPRTPVEQTLAAIWAEVLRLERVGVRDGFFELGGDSILAIQVVSRARRAGVHITPRQLFEYQTVAELASVAGAAVAAPAAEQGRVQGAAPITPIQAWFFAHQHAAPWHHNQSVLLEVDDAVDADVLAAALPAVLEHHDALRLRFRRTDAGWEQWHAEQVGIALERIDLAALAPEEQDARQGEIAGERQAGLELEHGPIGHAVLFDRGERGRILFVVLHHLVVDAVSWRILRDDLERACAQLQAGERMDLGGKSTSFAAWGRALADHAASDAVRAEADWWLAQNEDKVAALPVDGEGGRTVADARTVNVSLDAEETRALLQEVPAAYRTQINDVLLCALAESVGAWTGSGRVRLALEGHGREEEVGPGVDLTRTVGWFTSIYPVVLDVAGAAAPGERLKRVKEQLRAVPGRGIGYGALRWMSPDPRVRAALDAQPEPEISFNYLGQFDAGSSAETRFRFAGGRRGRESAAENARRYLLDVNGSIAGGCLWLSWTYGEGTHRRETVERLAEAYVDALRGLIAHCRQAGAGGYTPSDFPLAELAQEELDALAAGGGEIEDLYPLAPLQEGMLFHALYGGESQAYQVQIAYRLEGPLDADLLRRAWAEVASRHAILRTSFAWDGLRRPLQRVHAAVELPWTAEDWRGRSAGEQEAALEAYLEADRARGFALDQAPLLRFALFQLDDEARWLVWNQHHLLLDGWSSSRVLNEVFRLYGAWSRGEGVELPRVRPYRDYIGWLRRQDPGAAERYWRGVLAGFVAPTPFGVDRPAGPGAGKRYARLQSTLAPESTRRLEEAARRRQVTLNTVVQGAWALLLSRYGGEEDVVFGNTVSGRPPELEGVEEMVGLFINTLPARVQVPGDARLWAWLAEVQRGQAESREYEYAPLVQVQGWSEVPRGTPLFESQVVFENYPVGRAAAGGSAARLRVAGGRAVEWTTYPLALMAAPGAGLLLALRYDESRFDAGTVERMLQHLSRVLEQAADDADPRLSEIALLGEDERRLVVEEWNRADDGYPADVCIHHRFQAQAARTPDAAAVVFGGDSLTYAELNARANRLAHHLADLGVGPEVRVGICLERGMELVVSILAVLKAGGAYVPLDPAYPADRLAFMLADSGVPVVLTQRSARGALPASAGVAIVSVDEDAAVIEARSAENPESGAGPEHLAYVIYTSGSTGTPKGALIEHRNVARLFTATDAWFGFGERDVWTLFHSSAFDFSVWELWGALLYGGRLVVVPLDVSRDPDAFHALVRREGVTVLNQTPSAFRQLIRADGEHGGELALRLVIFGGEALEPASLREWVQRRGADRPRLVNMYGITETTVHVTYRPLTEADVFEGGGSPIGVRIPDLQLYVLDPTGRPVPVGVPGELYVGGGGVARGYLNRPELTAARFVENPFGAGRLYRTGDRVRWRDDGTLEYLGRLDEQVKVRGFRIELGEIEAALLSHDSVRECAVIVREDAPGDRRIVAYLVRDADAEALRAHLRQGLPEYMIPAAFVALDALPLTANGKLDRRALPAPELGAGERFVAPRTPAEETLAAVWADVLRIERVGVDDSFFALGGDSILAIQVVSRARRAGVHITPRQLFEYPTVAELASVAGGGAEAPAAVQARPRGAVRLTPIQARFLDQPHPAPWHYNQSLLLEVDDAVAADALQTALAAVLDHHDALRLRFRRTDAGWEQWHAEQAGIALERIDLTHLDVEAQDTRQGEIAGERQAGLELEHGPIGRAVLFDRGGRGRVLLIVLHHLVVDAVSWRILREDLERACAQVEAGEPVELGARSASFAGWARALDAYAASDALRAESGHWLAQNADKVAALPVDGEGGRTVAGGRVVTARLDAEETRALLTEVPAAYRTQINDVLLCALAEAVSAWTGTPRVRVAMEGHGREEEIGAGIDLTRTVGWFTSIYPVVLDVTGAAGPGERLKRVKEQLRAVPRRGIGYGVLRWMSPDAEVRAALAAQPEPEISFNYLGQLDAGIAIAERFRFGQGARGPEGAGENHHPFLLDVSGSVGGGCLQMSWRYHAGVHRGETIQRLAAAYMDALRGLIAHCRESGAGGCTPSDFPLAGLTQQELDALPGGARDAEDLYPLSPMQEGLLFHALYGGESQAYQVQITRRLEGPLDAELLRRAWTEVVSRHAILRTSFVWEGLRRPLQRVHAAVQVPWVAEDWTGLADGEQEAALERYLAADRARGFVLEEAPLLRCALFRAADDAHWLVWSQHHLLTDGWSASRVLNEVFRLYGAWSTGQAVELRRVRPYRDYIGWLQRQDPDAAERYWRGVLAGFCAATPFGVDRAAAAGAAPRFAKRQATLPAELTRRLEETARRTQVTLNTVLQGVWGLLLSRYSGEDDVVFGTTVSGRPPELEGVEEMIGLFINTLPARMRIRGDARVGAWLDELQRAQAEAREYEFSPLSQVQGWSDVPRGTPLFESHFIFENYPVERGGGGSGSPARLRITAGRAIEWNTYPLSLMTIPGPELRLALSYDENRFDTAVIERMLDHVRRVLEQVAADGDVRLAELALIGADERARVVHEWNRTEAPYPADRCIHHLFAAQAARTPDAVAVVYRDDSLTYAQLDARANQLANHLRRLGVGPEVRVGLCLERGLALMVGILGVMKAGGAYVPVDPAHPAERIGYVLEDSAVPVLLTQETLRDRLPVRDGVRIVTIDTDWTAIAAESAEAPESGVTPENLAYVIYTSGSTGRPKGVAMHHRGVCNYIDWGIRHYGADTGNGAPVFSSMAVDLTITNLLPLFAGLPIRMLPEENAVEALAAVLRERPDFGLIKITPTHLALLTPLLTPEDAQRAARTLVIGADFLPAEPTVWWQDNAPGVRLMNEYGPTETVVGCSAYTLPNGVHRNGSVPVGGAIQNLTFYVLDAYGQPVPVGLPGELYIGGAGVARGYLGRPALSAEKFVPDPFAGSGARMYRTGDRARWLEGGNLLILGRTDNQVKVRGYRVELGEIEAALRRHDAVSGAIAVVREDVPGDRRLVAYVVSDAEPEALREHLRRSLPEYMVPNAFVRLESLPRTTTGKYDPRSLPAPEYAAAEDRYVAPRTPAEETLAGIWAEVLRVARVGVNDSFFELGGDSILSIQVVSRARRAGVQITPRQLFEYPTVAELASVAGVSAEAARPEQARAEGIARLTPIQAWFFEQDQPAPWHYNQSMLFEVDAGVDGAALQTALAAVLDHHDALRLRFRRTDAGWEQWHAADAGIALEHIDLSHLDPPAQDAAQAEIAGQRQAALHLEDGPAGRAVLFHRGARDRVLFIVLHHLVVDGVSWRILRDDLERACAQLEAGEPVDLGARGTAYGEWAEALHRYAADGARAEAAYWLAHNEDKVAGLPVDGRGAATVAASATVAVRLDEEETRALLTEVPAAYRTQINDVLLCALAESVGAWMGSPRVRLALEGHGREEEIGAGIDLTRTVGWFTSLYPVVLDITGADGPGERLKRVKEQLRAVPLRGIGYGALRWMSPDAELRRALAAQAEPEISFNYLGQFDGGASADERIRFATGARGLESAPENRPGYPLNVNGAVRGGRLQLSWTFAEGMHRRETIERLAAAWLQALRGLIAHCREAGAGGCTPSDFPLAELSQEQLDALTAGATDVEDLYPLSPMQEGMLFHALSVGGSQAYQAQVAQRLEGPLDVALLRRAWAEVVARHPMLRTSFVWQGLPRPLQRVHAAAEVPWTTEDWRGLSADAQAAALDRFLADDRERGFVLDRAPLLRCAVLRVGDGAHWFVWSQHHLLTDGWTSSRVIREVFRLYRAWSTGEPVELRRVRPYRDYIGWLRRQDANAAERYWRGVLDGFAPPTPLPADRPAASGAPMRPAKRTLSIPEQASARLGEAARAMQVTLNTVLQGVWGLLLSRYTGEDDVVFGTTVSGRPAQLEGVEEMIGLFINTLPVRMRIRGDARVGAWLDELQRAQAESREYEYSPLAQVQGWSGVPRGTPLFESHFIFENYPVERGAAAGAASPARLLITDGRTVEWNTYPLSFMAIPGRELRLSVSYDENRFDASTIDRMLSHAERLLEQVAAGAELRLAEVELIGAEERALVVHEWNRTGAAYPADRCIHQLFAAQAARTPDAAAIVYRDDSLTYAQLDARANQLANHLRRMGVGPEVRVGLCLERGLELMVGILGVMKAGGAYVPVDPAHPAERIGYVLEDSAVPVLLTQETLRERLPVRDGVRIVTVDTDWTAIAAESAEALESGVTSENLAYVIYTSGSTGRPKGVAMHHRGVCNYIDWGIRHYGADTGNGAPVFSSMAVDLTITNLLPLFAGLPIRMLPEENAVEALAAVLRERPDFGLIKITPTHLALLTPLLTPEDAQQAARTLVIGADFLPAEPTVWWQDNAPGVRLMNEYGPTETVVGCSAYTLPNGLHRNGSVPVGGAIQNLTFYVLDAYGQPVPVGLPGELYIGGAGVARGYLGRPGLSAEKFVPDPFAGGGARMYRTGDRARWLEGGNLLILGRTDHQVKVRGYRVELGEIEAALRRHDAVSGAIAVVREDVPGDRRLVAYVVSDAEPEALREHLRRALPEYMVPNAFVRLESLPRTSTGKYDPRSLPAPEYAAAEDRYVAPRTPTEETLAGIWAGVLGVERVGAEDGFFELGGHSLLAIRLVSRVRELLGVELPLRALLEGPTVAGLAAAVEALRRADAPVLPPVVPVDRTEPLPLSFAQERLWFLDRLQPGSPFYNVTAALRLQGTLDSPALVRALGEIVRRHEALRTVFAEADGAAVQVIASFAGFDLPVEDLSSTDPAEREGVARRRAADLAARPFDLEAGPLFRPVLLRLADDDHLLLLSMHHVVSDAWSTGVLLRELSALYTAYLEGRPSPLPELPVQYADYAVWQRRQLAGDALERELAYWRRRLDGAPALLELPSDHPRPAVQSFRGAQVQAAFSAELAGRLRALGRREGATMYMVLLAAFQVLLSKYSGSADVVVGSPVAGRTRAETEALIGFFLNTLALRTDLSGNPTFRQLLRRVREVTLDAYEHQALPFERVVEEVQPERSLSHAALFQALFTVQEAGAGWSGLPGLRVLRAPAEVTATKYDLTLGIGVDEGLHAALEYSTDLFERPTAERMLAHLERLLQQIADDADVRLADLELAGEAERRLVRVAEGTPADYPADSAVHALFAAQAARTPDAVAAVFDEGSLTYTELDARANRLAHHLAGLGVGPESRVGICLERGLEMVVSMLAVLKAGGAYVPLDPGYPAERLAFMLRDAGAQVLLTREGLRAALPAAEGAAVVSIDGDADAIAAARADDPRIATGPRALAYIIYTSGSTGTPKGVAVEHRGVVRLVRGTDYVQVGPDDRVAHASNVSFDAATFEVWGALLNGAALVGISRDAALSPQALARALAENGVTTFFLTTALFNQVARELPRAFAPLRHVLFGGEAVDPDAVRRVLEQGAPERLLHVYGPTENTTYSSWHRVDEVPAGAHTVPIGRAIAHSSLLVLDDAMRLAPVGLPGELYVGGDGVARGYLNRPALTAEKFVPDPFSSTPGARLYRTGDRVRWVEGSAEVRECVSAEVEDGARTDSRTDALTHSRTHTLEYLGRLDTQVKIRGFRIEPDEVGAALRRQPGVDDCTVVVREDAPGEKRLVAYVAGQADADALRDALRAELPEYMVPAAVVVLDSLPLNPNGKVDRRALPAPEYAAGAARFVAPRTPTEEVLAEIWAEVLRVERVGAGDGFFELGGHSLMAVRMVSRVREVFAVELPLRALFEGPTLEELAERVDALRRDGIPVAPPVVPVERTEPLPLSFAQERLWFLDRLQPGSAAYNVPLALRLRGPLDAGALEHALGEVVRRHEALRTVFTDVCGAPVQVAVPFAGFALPVEELSALDADAREARVRRRAADEAVLPFDLATGPLFRAALLRLGDEEHVLLVTLHHVVSDGWSLGVFFREISALYGAFREGRESPLPELPVQYADYAVWQRARLAGPALAGELAWWRERLAGAPTLLELPTDRPRPAEQSFEGAYEALDFDSALLERLRALGRGEGATLFMVLLGAWQLLLSRYAGSDDVVVGTAVAGRERRETEGLIGFFVNNLALRTDLSGDPSFRETLRRVREATLGAFDHQEVPFERLVGELQPERSLSHAPLVQVTFGLNQGESSAPGLPGVRAEAVATDAGTTKFDLSLSLSAGADTLRGSLSYATALFDRATILRMGGHLARVLDQVTADPDLPLSRIGLLAEGECRALLAWSGTAAPADQVPVHALFAAQAARTPDAEALRFGGRATTYRELDDAANRLAHHLVHRGVRLETPVGVFAERAPETVTAILAILKAGGAYVPLDPAYPADRLRHMLADCGARTVIAPAGVPDGVSTDLVPDLLDPRAEADAIAARPSDAPRVAVHPEALAYVIYTSGSTGRPKGVMVPHRGVPNLARAQAGPFGVEPASRVLQFASMSFDAAVSEIFATLLAGATLVLATREELLPGDGLTELLRRECISLVTLPPSVLAVLPPGELPELRTVVSAGEALDAATMERWSAGRTLVNAYGPTETTVCATCGACRADGRTPSIGRPIDGMRVHVLDAAGEPAPIGVPGELFVGGAGVARGYRGRPALTAERFVPDPFSTQPGARMYRTGDRARWTETSAEVRECVGAEVEDGAARTDALTHSRTHALQFLGRLDAQVKVRGFRIEPGEVEAALRRHPGVADCAVVARADGAGMRLVAYVVGGADADALRAHLRGTLPEYMVPGAFVPLERLPVTPNGKVDRAALPAPSFASRAASPAPRSVREQQVAEVWREVLGVEAIGVGDNFFDLGGTSLLLYRVFSRLREIRGDLRVVDLFRHTTVEELARHLDADAADGADDPALERSRSRGEARRAARGAGRMAGRDAGRDAGRVIGWDAGREAGRDPGQDVGRGAERDAARDAGREAGAMAGRDAGPVRDRGNE